jgi:hypothetical protein
VYCAEIRWKVSAARALINRQQLAHLSTAAVINGADQQKTIFETVGMIDFSSIKTEMSRDSSLPLKSSDFCRCVHR